MLVGSSAKLLCLVQAEVLSSAYVPARPFRVNAGPVHSYVRHTHTHRGLPGLAG